MLARSTAASPRAATPTQIVSPISDARRGRQPRGPPAPHDAAQHDEGVGPGQDHDQRRGERERRQGQQHARTVIDPHRARTRPPPARWPGRIRTWKPLHPRWTPRRCTARPDRARQAGHAPARLPRRPRVPRGGTGHGLRRGLPHRGAQGRDDAGVRAPGLHRVLPDHPAAAPAAPRGDPHGGVPARRGRGLRRHGRRHRRAFGARVGTAVQALSKVDRGREGAGRGRVRSARRTTPSPRS